MQDTYLLLAKLICFGVQFVFTSKFPNTTRSAPNFPETAKRVVRFLAVLFVVVVVVVVSSSAKWRLK